jgi:hypothetical protein
MDPQLKEKLLLSIGGEAQGVNKDSSYNANFSALKTELTDSPISVLEDEVSIII